MAFAEEGSPAFFAGAFDVVQSTYLDEPKGRRRVSDRQGSRLARAYECLFRVLSDSSVLVIAPISLRTGFPSSTDVKKN